MASSATVVCQVHEVPVEAQRNLSTGEREPELVIDLPDAKAAFLVDTEVISS
ncbi:hypothetical protein [Catellatospora sp. NPDC049609]|uniref:hypothetical protein n=1 Tax=Catellatospora sp. NPDC049609 TaxID=3155505 RepID=UPI00342CA006